MAFQASIHDFRPLISCITFWAATLSSQKLRRMRPLLKLRYDLFLAIEVKDNLGDPSGVL